ncbi:hypothetical protein AYO38_05605 [bacterium SCGC AG-212-C10]|nr:hypothetical protein AYO38_05605 [bacterium SCGC AG-212-C10]
MLAAWASCSWCERLSPTDGDVRAWWKRDSDSPPKYWLTASEGDARRLAEQLGRSQLESTAGVDVLDGGFWRPA